MTSSDHIGCAIATGSDETSANMEIMYFGNFLRRFITKFPVNMEKIIIC